MLNARELTGCSVALITPMRRVEGNPVAQVDFERYEQHIRQMIDAGVRGLVFAGTTGQSATLTHDEHVEVVVRGANCARQYAEQSGRSLLLIAGAGSNATHEAIHLSQRIAAATQVDALLHVTGYYNNPPQEGLLVHFTAVADAMQNANLPIILYNVPGRTGSNLAAETVIRLARHPNIIGIKEASGDLEKVDQIIAETDRDSFCVVSGEDHLVYEIMRRGGTGVISATANRWPREYQRLTELALAGRWEDARELQEALLPCSRAVFSVKNPIPLAYMFQTGLRLPLVGVEQLEEPLRQKVEGIIQEAVSIRCFPYCDSPCCCGG